jgi:hypothetical protein
MDNSKAERENEFADTPTGWAQRWQMEFSAAKKFIKTFHKQSEKVYNRFLDDRKATGSEDYSIGDFTTRLNLFHANITTLQAMLYGRIPKVDVDRRYADQDDDIARVAGEILQRILNTDIEDAGEDYSYVLRSSLGDRLIGGFGTARVKYDFTEKTEEVPAQTDPITGAELAPAYTEEKVEDEWVDVIYTHWRDVLWSPCRTHAELRWRAYRAYMTRDELTVRFKEIGKDVPLNSRGPKFEGTEGKKRDGVWDQAEVWEIWDKQHKKVFWYVDGYDRTLDMKNDPLGLDGYFPEPPPMIANLTTNKYIPKSDFVIAQDLYNEIDILETRINLLTAACKAVGVYDKGNDGIQRLLMEGVENQLIPVDNWGAFAEKGGLKGAVDWLPIEQVANVIAILTEKQTEKISLLYQVTGMSDILRGASDPRATATAESAKAKFASIRVQAMQDEFSRFASDLMRLKAEIISKHYQPYCIIQQSNIMTTPDAQLAEQAVQLIKDPKSARWRIVVKPESLAMVDYAQLKQDRTEFITALSTFMQSAAPLVQLDKAATGPLLELLKWGLAGFKGSNEIEGVMDRAISNFQKKQQSGEPEKPDPEQIKAQAEIKKSEMDMQMAQFKMQAEKERLQMEMQQSQQEHDYKMLELQTKHHIAMAEIQAKAQATLVQEQAQAEGAAAEAEASAEAASTEAVIKSAATVEANKSKKENGSAKDV